LTAAGYDIAGTPGTGAAAPAAMAAGAFDFAILDTNLCRQRAAPIAAALKMQTIPFVIARGYDPEQLAGSFSGAPCLTKPSAIDDVL
jgi:DNA-binding response OmpR family regulator